MQNDLKHKMYMGFRGFMMRIPPRLAAQGAKQSEKGTKANAERLSPEERRVHHFIVRQMAVVTKPITAASVANELGLPKERVHQIIDKLESLKTFIYRDDGLGVNWAYPLSLANTGFKMTASSGEQFFAA